MSWVKGINLDEKNNFLCCWDTSDIYIYNFFPFQINLSNSY